MDYLLDNDGNAPAEREFTLSTGSILGLFFGLVLLCGLFFGFGYSVGSHKSPPVVSQSTSVPATTTNFNAFKPAAGLPAGASVNAAATPHSTTPAITVPASPPSSQARSVATDPAASATPAPIIRLTPSPQPAARPASAAASIIANGSAPSGSFLVQIAAVSHQQDAALLMNALRIKGYAPSAFLEADKLVHVQLGPYNNRHDADLMRQRLVSDGYSPIIK